MVAHQFGMTNMAVLSKEMCLGSLVLYVAWAVAAWAQLDTSLLHRPCLLRLQTKKVEVSLILASSFYGSAEYGNMINFNSTVLHVRTTIKHNKLIIYI